MEKLSGLMLCIFKFRKFSDSRWATIGGEHPDPCSCLGGGPAWVGERHQGQPEGLRVLHQRQLLLPMQRCVP
eukprot:10655933-Alexandrium_andersonii.AAC.1